MKKTLLIFALFLLCWVTKVKAQNGDFEIKVISNKYRTVKGQLKKVSVEGIGVVDYFGNYFIFKPNEIVRIKIRKRGLTIGEGAGIGALAGLVPGLLLISLDGEEGKNGDDLLKLTAALTVGGAAAGTITGAVAQIVNVKLTLKINERDDKYKAAYKKLEKYVIEGTIEHVN